MKKLIMLFLLMLTIVACTEIEYVKKQMKERGHGCYRDPYYGNIKCGYRR